MVDEKQIKQWLNEGTITLEQANKMIRDSRNERDNEKSSNFISIIAIIGAVLIFVGFAWILAKNWHQINSFLKVIILVSATLTAFVSGVIFRQKDHEGVGRSLIALGALLFILSLFLISQTYHLAVSEQHYAWILFLAWTVILATSYLLDSEENLVVAMLTFFPWIILQYGSSLTNTSSSEENLILGFVFIFLGVGALFFGLSAFHKAIKHKFASIYQFWTAFYFLGIFYLMSFQSILPILSGYSFGNATFSIFAVSFIILCFFGFLIGSISATSKNSLSAKEIMAFIGILAILLLLIFSTKVGEGTMGDCYQKRCYDFKTSSECLSSQDNSVCNWTTSGFSEESYCGELSCYSYSTESGCSSAPAELDCFWSESYCRQKSEQVVVQFGEYNDECSQNNNQKEKCLTNSDCKWHPSRYMNRSLPISLWFLWILNNICFVSFIILVLWYGQKVGSTKIVNLALITFVLEIISRYIGFWLDFRGYIAFSILAILGGVMLIFGAWAIPKWRRNLIEETKKAEGLV